LPSALIHDAIYGVIKDNLEVLTFSNTHLIKSMRWQELPEIQHPTVKLGAAIDVFWPAWDNAITLPNEATSEQILEVCAKGKQKYLDKHRA
jgi:DNA polymerase-1